jgi:hypothetical protein
MTTRISLFFCIAATIAATTPAVTQARHAPDDRALPQQRVHYTSADLNQQDMLGPKYIAASRTSSADAASAAVGKSARFDWRDASAGVAAVVLVLALAAARLLRRGNRAPETPTAASPS